jgi:hypothetical protein
VTSVVAAAGGLSAARLDEHEGDVIGEHELVDVLSPW